VKQAWAKPAILLTLAGLSPGTLQCQCAPDTAAILKDLPTQIPGLPPAIVRIKGNTVEADYYIAGSNLPPDPQYGHRTRPLKISVSSYPTQQEAEHDVQMSVRLTSISPTQTPTSAVATLYKWDADLDRGFHRITARLGTHAVTVTGASQPEVAKAFETLALQLGATR
jgi:hypothetical protein